MVVSSTQLKNLPQIRYIVPNRFFGVSIYKNPGKHETHILKTLHLLTLKKNMLSCPTFRTYSEEIVGPSRREEKVNLTSKVGASVFEMCSIFRRSVRILKVTFGVFRGSFGTPPFLSIADIKTRQR